MQDFDTQNWLRNGNEKVCLLCFQDMAEAAVLNLL